MSSFNRKRAPFAPADIGNRKNVAANGDAAPPSSKTSSVHKKRLEPPSSVFSKAPPRAPVSSILAKNGIRSRSRSRHRLEPPEQKTMVPSVADTHANNDRARVYKAEAYEAKIRIASQEQRIEALQAELEEIKFFQLVEQEGSSSDVEEQEKKSKDDAELIEALAQELETMEKNLKMSQLRVGELEHDLLERSKPENDVSATQSRVKAQLEKREIELRKQLERQQTELTNVKKDVHHGMCIMKEITEELTKARLERDDAVSTLRSERGKMQDDNSKRMVAMKELEESLKSMQNERDEALSELSSLRNEVKDSSTKRETIEKSNKELQKVLETVQVQSEKKIEQMKQDHKILAEDYHQQMKDFEEQKQELEEVEDLHAINIANLKEEHSIELEEIRKKEGVNSGMEDRLAQELKTKDDLLKSRESYWASEIEALKSSLLKTSSNDMEGPHDEMMDILQRENTKLKAEKDDLLEIHKKTTVELDAKIVELQNLQANAAQGTVEDVDSLKMDYTSAVELSISRGKQIQSMEKDMEMYQTQLANAIKKIKKMEKKSQATVANGSGMPNERLQAEVSALRAKAEKSDATISALKQELSHSTKSSITEQLKRDLANSQQANDESKAKIVHLEEAIKDMQTALKAASSCKMSPQRGPSPIGHKARRNQLEKNALKEYCAQRLQTEK